ncbi:DUF3290 domain-containing protein [Kurthia sibirica]|uniref:DUF3290 domain-containing protein n=1 Tax=Kurthia sibirica TaxID=202750 RepID=A0A2U3AP75_9BACL|nr:DUF3290 domain-containing protein [Kurthia sibirica]PWI26331.1 hypothetical protein DEX24_03060 [Kurthia sibirica]GEK35685.1 hypothetical protein KSI01_32180 [Kurthia sibirica]
MDFYGTDYLNSQSAFKDYLKYILIFSALIFLIIVFSLYIRRKMDTKYRDLSIILFLILLFLSGLQYNNYTQNENKHTQSTQMLSILEQVAATYGVDLDSLYVNSPSLNDEVIIKMDNHYYLLVLSSTQQSFTLEETFLAHSKINIIK